MANEEREGIDRGEIGGNSPAAEVARMVISIDSLASELEVRAMRANQGGEKASAMSAAFLGLGAAFRVLADSLFRMGKGFAQVSRELRKVKPLLVKARQAIREAEGDQAKLERTLEGLTAEAESITRTESRQRISGALAEAA